MLRQLRLFHCALLMVVAAILCGCAENPLPSPTAREADPTPGQPTAALAQTPSATAAASEGDGVESVAPQVTATPLASPSPESEEEMTSERSFAGEIPAPPLPENIEWL